MKLDQIALFAVVAFGMIWLGTTVTGLLVAVPFGLIGLVPIALFLGVLAAVIWQRMTNKEDDYYDRNVDQ